MAVLEQGANYNIAQEIVCKQQGAVTYNSGVVYDYFKDSTKHFLHSNISSIQLNASIASVNNASDSEKRQYIKLKKRIFELSSKLEFINEKTEIIDNVIDNLVKLNFDSINISLTHDNSIFYSFIVNDKKYHIEHFLDYEGEDDDIEFSLVYNDGPEYISFGGDLNSVFKNLYKTFDKSNIDLQSVLV